MTMTLSRDRLLRILHETLEVDRFADASVNGLQVQGTGVISRVATGVSVSAPLIRAARRWGAQALVVHHGLLWKGAPPEPVAGPLRQRLKLLLDADMNLLAYHLPLDAHADLGNNADLARRLGLEDLHPADVGWGGRWAKARPLTQVIQELRRILGTEPVMHGARPRLVRRVLIVTGSGSSVAARHAADYDLCIGGDIREEHMWHCAEAGIGYAACGHTASEKLGVRNLAGHLRRALGLETRFFDIQAP